MGRTQRGTATASRAAGPGAGRAAARKAAPSVIVRRLAAGACLLAATFAAAGNASAAPAARHGRRLCASRPAPPSRAAGRPAARPLTATAGAATVWRFVSAPGLHPMRVKVLTRRARTAPGLFFAAPYSLARPAGQTGSLILGAAGSPVWFRPLPSPRLQDTDFRVQPYRTRKSGPVTAVLTWWQGTIAIPPDYTNLPPGSAEPGGCYYIYDDRYRLVRTISARDGFAADEHEFLLTANGAALFIASKPVRMDLRRYGGPANGAVEDDEVQEVSLATGKLIFSWDMLRHVSPGQSQTPASAASASGGVWDAYHLNSIAEAPHDQLLLSARDMWAVYDISMRTGRISWQLGGRRSDFSFGPNASFSWQHDARLRPGATISMFDNGCCNPPGSKPQQQSHGLVLRLDFKSHRATALRTYYHQPGLNSASQGNAQSLRNGDMLIGWGQSPFYSEYAGAGNSAGHGLAGLRYDARLPSPDISYRVFRDVWAATPWYPPSVAARPSGARRVVYASWNGSTQTTAWRVLAGPGRRCLSVAVWRKRRTGFETAVTTASPGPYFQVKALSRTGRVIGVSPVVRLSR